MVLSGAQEAEDLAPQGPYLQKALNHGFRMLWNTMKYETLGLVHGGKCSELGINETLQKTNVGNCRDSAWTFQESSGEGLQGTFQGSSGEGLSPPGTIFSLRGAPLTSWFREGFETFGLCYNLKLPNLAGYETAWDLRNLVFPGFDFFKSWFFQVLIFSNPAFSRFWFFRNLFFSRFLQRSRKI